MTIKCAVQNIRVIRPISVDRFIAESWSFRLKGTPESAQRTLLYSRLINSSKGMVGPDDLEVYRRAQTGLASSASDWVEFHRQYGKDQVLADRVVVAAPQTSICAQYRAWKSYMEGSMQGLPDHG